ncbi:hypothetical protein [Tunturiibacter gelidiferens]|uniref:hypothetical protein n=1 Tax=Tunturiibacter gelidiferens TaxID=3069689 RepID=UPI003D9B721D
MDGHVALEDHVAGEDLGEGDFGLRGEGGGEEAEGEAKLHERVSDGFISLGDECVDEAAEGKVSFMYLTGSGWGENALGFGFGSEMRGSLHCALHDETVKRFGRDDCVLGVR